MASVTKVGALPLVYRQGRRVRGGVALSLSVVVVRNPEQRTFSLWQTLLGWTLDQNLPFLRKFWIHPMFTDVMIAEWDIQCRVSL